MDQSPGGYGLGAGQHATLLRFGSHGYMREYAVRCLDRGLASSLWEGTADIQRLVVAHHLLERGSADLVTSRVPCR
jgi:alkylation response protein AidB-like acyl-CoA dehydrogenase